MPASSTISSADKERVRSVIPSTTSKILTASVVRIYYAHPSPDSWSYAGLQGALVLVSDKLKGGFWFRLVDLVVRNLYSSFSPSEPLFLVLCCRAPEELYGSMRYTNHSFIIKTAHSFIPLPVMCV